MRGIVVGLVLVGVVGCSRVDALKDMETKASIAARTDGATNEDVKLPDRKSLDLLLDIRAKAGAAAEMAAYEQALQDIEALGKIDQQHEKRLLETIRTTSMDDLPSLVRALSKEPGSDVSTSPSHLFLSARVVKYIDTLPEFRELTVWGWENILSPSERKGGVVQGWGTNYASVLLTHLDDHHKDNLMELIRSLRSGQKPSEPAVRVYSTVFGKTRYPAGW